MVRWPILDIGEYRLLASYNQLSPLSTHKPKVLKAGKHGRGKNVYASGNKYEGDWKNDEKHGRGLFVLKNGDSCEGDWWGNQILEKGEGRQGGRKVKCYTEPNGSISFE